MSPGKDSCIAPPNNKRKIFLPGIAGLLLVSALLSHYITSLAKPAMQSRRPVVIHRNEQGSGKYSRFTHDSHGKHSKDPHARNLQCSDCHVISSATEADHISASGKPNAKSSYPYHDSCLRCHEQQFFRGDRPPICLVCHTRSAVRLTARDVYAKFPSSNRSDITRREFPGYFPHALHQAVMASNSPRARFRGPFTYASFRTNTSTAVSDDDVCSRCHVLDRRDPSPLPRNMLDRSDSFSRVLPDTFETIPGARDSQAHGFCFSCHWETQKPTSRNCEGCHFATADYAAIKEKAITPPALSPRAESWFANWPDNLPRRFSLKFRHDTHTASPDGRTESNNHDFGCTTCHSNIAAMTTLNIPKADVRISACGPCHATTSGIPVAGGSRMTISDEMDLKSDPGKNYTCVACHTVIIGAERPPCSHYSVIGRQCPAPKKAVK